MFCASEREKPPELLGGPGEQIRGNWLPWNADTFSRPTSNQVEEPLYVPLQLAGPPQPWSWLLIVKTIFRQGNSPRGEDSRVHRSMTS